MTNLILTLVLGLGLAGPASDRLPPNIAVAAIYRQAVVEMLRYSPTFRRQCSRLARASELRIAVRTSLMPGLSLDEAVTRIVRLPNGEMDAGVDVGPSGDPTVLIAHEFEHVLEQLDGVDLPSMASRSATGVHRVRNSGHFETERAIAAGRRVAEEVSRGRARNGS